MERHKLYLVGGTARTMKSLIAPMVADQISRGQYWQWGIIQDDLSLMENSIIKNLFLTGSILEFDADELAFNVEITYGPNIPQRGFFQKSLSTSLIAPVLPKDKSAILLSTDVIRSCIRRIFLKKDEGLGFLGFDGVIFYRKNGIEVGEARVTLSQNDEDYFAWKVLSGIVRDYDRENLGDLVVEGIAITPERVRELRLALRNFQVKTAFTGYNTYSKKHVQSYVTYLNNSQEAKQHSGWLYNNFLEWKKTGRPDEEFIEMWIEDQVEEGRRRGLNKREIQRSGFSYFDIGRCESEEEVKQYIQAIANFLMQE